MKRLRWATLALDDLEQLRDYLRLRDPAAARRVVEAVRERAKLLKQHPMAGPPLDIGEARKLSVGRYPYLLVYRVSDGEVTILRVHHAAEAWRDDS